MSLSISVLIAPEIEKFIIFMILSPCHFLHMVDLNQYNKSLKNVYFAPVINVIYGLIVLNL